MGVLNQQEGVWAASKLGSPAAAAPSAPRSRGSRAYPLPASQACASPSSKPPFELCFSSARPPAAPRCRRAATRPRASFSRPSLSQPSARASTGRQRTVLCSVTLSAVGAP